MKFFKQHLPFFSVLMTLAVLNWSCSNNFDDIDTNSELSNNSEKSGVDIFKGIYFMQPEFVKNVPQLKNTLSFKMVSKDKNLRNRLDVMADIIIKNIKADDSNFFERYGEQMKSGNQILVMSAMESAAIKMKSSMEKLIGETGINKKQLEILFSKENLKSVINSNGSINEQKVKDLFEKYRFEGDSRLKNGDEQLCIVAGVVLIAAAAVFVVAAFNIAVALNVAAAVNAAAAVNGAITINSEVNGDINFSGGLVDVDSGDITRRGDFVVMRNFKNRQLKAEILINELTYLKYD